MEWDLVEMEPNYSLFFNFIVFLQVVFLIFVLFYFVNLLVDIVQTKKKLYALKIGFTEVGEKKLLQDKLLVQKEKYRMNTWLMPIIDHLYFYGESKNLNDRRVQQEKLFSAFAEKISKNSYLFKFLIIFSVSSGVFIFSEANPYFELGWRDILTMIVISSIVIALSIVILCLKKHFFNVLKKYIDNLQMIISNGKN